MTFLPVTTGDAAVFETETTRIEGVNSRTAEDKLAVEEPLEIRIGDVPVAITMRTPGHDAELALGFLFSEGVVRSVEEVSEILPWGPSHGDARYRNIARVTLHPSVRPDLDALKRNFYATSSCGLCGKASLERLRTVAGKPLDPIGPVVEASTVHRMPEALRAGQEVFGWTGGLHAAGLFNAQGALLRVREDVGRHNAVDKVIGSLLFERSAALAGSVLFVSGRAGFELAQKAIMAAIPILAAVGAPSSLALRIAQASGLTLIGFVREHKFNIYSGEHRIRLR